MPLGLQKVDSVKAAATLLASDPASRLLAGGTLIVRQTNDDDGRIASLIPVDGLGLDRIAVAGNRATLGSGVTMSGIASHPRLAFLAPVAESIGGPAIRNMATVGGNLFAPAPYGDLCVALLALDATVALEGASGARAIGIEEFLAGRGRLPGVVASVSFDLPPAGAFRFVKNVRRKPHSAAVVTIVAVLPVAAGKVAGARIALGAMAPTAIRARAAEQALEGKALDAAAIAAATKVAAEGCRPATDAFATDWYRTRVVGVHLKRLLAGET